jgi:hypothetical protein
LINIFLESHPQAPQQIVLDLDTTDLPLHGRQQGRFFHGYHESYCYLPLYIFSGEHLLCARLRTVWPAVRIIVRADSGFCRDELMNWCEEHGVSFVPGSARNKRLRRIIEPRMREALRQHAETGKPARLFAEFRYETTTGSWSRPRRVVAEAEQLDGKQNPRFVVTSLGAEDWPARRLYEAPYCERDETTNGGCRSRL